MHKLLSYLQITMIVFLVTGVASAETVQIKAQGSSDSMIGTQEKAFQDAKKRALEKYISGIKSQSEANRLIDIKQQLFNNIDEYVKEPVELANEEKNGKTTVTIQAQIDVTSINNVIQKSFNDDRKKAGVKKKQIAFVFVAREIDTVTTVKDHNINEAVDNSVASNDESRDRSGKGNSKANAASKSSENKDSDTAISDDTSTAREENNRLAQKAKSSASGKTGRQGSASQNISLKGNRKSSSAESGEAKVEEDGDITTEDTGAVESGRRDASYRGKLAARGSVFNDSQEDLDIRADMTESSSNNEDFNTSVALDLNTEEAVKQDNKDKFKQNRSVKTKNAQDLAKSDSSDYETASSENEKTVVKAENSRFAESKNTAIQHAEERTYRVIESGTVTAQLSEIFKESGMKVSDSFDAGDLLLKLQKAKSVNQLRPADLKQAIAAAREEGTDYLCIGTLDVDREMIDKATGNIQRYVMVNANTYDLTKQKLEKAAAVGNLNFSGLGETPEVAKNNALSNSAKEAATKLVAQIRKHMLEEDED